MRYLTVHNSVDCATSFAGFFLRLPFFTDRCAASVLVDPVMTAAVGDADIPHTLGAVANRCPCLIQRIRPNYLGQSTTTFQRAVGIQCGGCINLRR
jgi:hypothetical protein